MRRGIARPVVLFALLSPICFAQFSSLVTNDDGSALYFVTRLKQKGTDQPNWGKIFRADASGLRLDSVIQRGAVADAAVTNYYDLSVVDSSGDGGLVARTGARECLIAAPACSKMNNFATELEGAASRKQTFSGVLRVSANGRFGLQIEPDSFEQTIRIIDLMTGGIVGPAVIPPTGAFQRATVADPGGRVIADNGTATFRTTGSFAGPESLWTYSPAGRLRQIWASWDLSITAGPYIDAAASGVTYAVERSVRRLDLQDGSEEVLADGTSELTSLQASRDGNPIEFVGGGQAYLLNGGGSCGGDHA